MFPHVHLAFLRGRANRSSAALVALMLPRWRDPWSSPVCCLLLCAGRQTGRSSSCAEAVMWRQSRGLEESASTFPPGLNTLLPELSFSTTGSHLEEFSYLLKWVIFYMLIVIIAHYTVFQVQHQVRNTLLTFLSRGVSWVSGVCGVIAVYLSGEEK